MFRVHRLLVCLGLAALSAACAGVGGAPLDDGADPKVGETYFTLSNLHPDPGRARMYSLNYQQAGLIPYCTEVRIDERSRKAMRFTVLSTGVQYEYLQANRKYTPDFLANLNTFFGKECVRDKVEALTGVDREGVDAGTPLVGMSKAAVIIALGPPPPHVNPTPETMGQWTYWKNRFVTQIISFDADGRVSSIQG